MSNPYNITKVHQDYTDQEWEEYYLFKKEYATIKEIDLSFDSWQKLKERSLYRMKHEVAIYLVWQNGQKAGDFSFNTTYKDQLDKRYSYFHSSLINETLNDDLLEKVFEAFLKFDPLAKFMAIKSQNGQHDFVEQKFGAFAGGNCETFELLIKETNLKKIESWVNESPSKFPNYRLEFYEDIPDNLLEEYCAVFTELLADMPPNSALYDAIITTERIRERQVNGKKNNHCSYRYLIFNENNQVIAKTNVAINKNKPEIMNQYMTGVLKDYRGQGLSKWLKGAMYNKLVEDFPSLEQIKTETHPENHASRELSKQMGYKKTGYQKEFLISKESISSFLTTKK